MPALLSRLSILFINYISRNLDNTKILLYKLFFRYLVVKPACVNATSVRPCLPMGIDNGGQRSPLAFLDFQTWHKYGGLKVLFFVRFLLFFGLFFVDPPLEDANSAIFC